MSRGGVAKQKKEMKRSRLIVSGAIAAIALGFVLFSNYGLFTRLSLELRHREIGEDIASAKRTQDSLRRYIRVLQSDTTEIERIARENYGMVRPGEEVYIIQDSSASENP